MQQVFKKLTTVIIWIFFVTGCLMILKILPLPFVNYYEGDWKTIALGLVSLSLAVVTIKFKKTME